MESKLEGYVTGIDCFLTVKEERYNSSCCESFDVTFISSCQRANHSNNFKLQVVIANRIVQQLNQAWSDPLLNYHVLRLIRTDNHVLDLSGQKFLSDLVLRNKVSTSMVT